MSLGRGTRGGRGASRLSRRVTVTGRTHFALPRRPPSRQLSRSSAGGGGGEGGAQPGGVCLGVRSGLSREGASLPSRSRAEGGGRWRTRAVVAGGDAAGGAAPMAVPKGKRCAAAVAVVSPPPLPLRGPVPSAAAPSARNAFVRAEAGPLPQLRGVRDLPQAPGWAPLWFRSARPAASQGGRGNGGVGGSAANALGSSRPWLSAVEAAQVWEMRRRAQGCFRWVKGVRGSSEVRNAHFWLRPRVAAFREVV